MSGLAAHGGKVKNGKVLPVEMSHDVHIYCRAPGREMSKDAVLFWRRKRCKVTAKLLKHVKV
ncbi:MAG: hypothetical protein EPN94_12630 [Nitrospirae bacterium]|nr:MAG: hypothetical protein EPN94_12630 [Nitrospirota bacterium]